MDDVGTSETYLAAASASAARVVGFAPGTVLADRYRIVALVGRGGMGEVYRADDLRLGQPVALKFLPAALASDAAAHQRLLAEVRNARGVSHPNVCRVYDVGDVDGRSFLTMEYIDGEDLASLLRRIGRLPATKALEIAQQLCAGLAAAHDRGVLHRDLKPANVMIDGRGHARITDFGLAVEVRPGDRRGRHADAAPTPSPAQAARADLTGTIAYMAPERFEGRPATVQSDVYALGLILYESYTGKPAFTATTLDGCRRAHSDSTPSAPSSVVADIDPAVERAILRCLEKDPGRRPASAALVAAALPGGDPLAAAIAAGETPSPELVAASGEEGTLPRSKAWLWLGACVVVLALLVVGSTAVNVAHLMRFDDDPGILQKKARDILAEIGYRSPAADSAWRIQQNSEYRKYATEATPPVPFDDFADAVPGLLVFRYRQGLAAFALPFVGTNTTPFSVVPRLVGEADVELDLRGHLIQLSVVAPQYDANPSPPITPDWSPLFSAAGLERSQFTKVEPRWWPEQASDIREAWEGPYGRHRVRVEAAARHGRPIFFRLIGSWTAPLAVDADESPTMHAFSVLLLVIVCGSLAVLGVLARRNLLLGRGDRRGAFRLAVGVGAVSTAVWMMSAHWSTRAPFTLLLSAVNALQISLGVALLAWLAYVGFEPYVRRRWPHMLVTWTRLLDGRWRDPLVGRSILVGLLLGCAWAVPYSVLLPRLLHLSGAAPVYADGSLDDVGAFLGLQLGDLLYGLLMTFLAIAVAVIARMLLRNTPAAMGVLGVLYFTMNVLILRGTRPSALSILIVLVVCAIFNVLFIWSLWKSGALTFTIMFAVGVALEGIPWTTHFARWYAWRSWFAVAIVLALAFWGFRNVLGRQSAFPAGALDD